MESDVAQLSIADRLLAWFEMHRKPVLRGSIVVVVLGVGIGFFIWQQNDRQARASEALSRITSVGLTATELSATPGALLKVATEYRKTDAAARALLLAGGDLYAQGKYAEAEAQFGRFLREYRDSPFADQALLGVAACLDARGKTPEAIVAYNDIVQHHSTDNVAPPAKLALAWLYEKQAKLEQARDFYLELSRGPYGSISSEAGIHLEALFAKHPELLPSGRAAPGAPAPVPFER
jgi:predicted negative regulator of RcsB-dependent stress response